MQENFGVVSDNQKPKKTIGRGFLEFFSRFNKSEDIGEFDRRGAFVIRKGLFGKKRISDSGSSGGGADSMAIWRPGGSQGVPASKAMDSHFGWVYAAVKAISDEMASIQFRLFEVKNNGEHEEVETHELLDLIDGVNEYQTGVEFKKVLSSHLELTGNAYALLTKKNNDPVNSFDEQPESMHLLNPGRTRVVVDRRQFPYRVIGYVLKGEGQDDFKFKPECIVHFKYPDPNDPIMGIGSVGGIAEWIDNDNYAMEFNRNFFKNGARLSGVFETDYSSIEQTQRLKVSFDEQFSGVKNAYKTLIMPKGVKFTSTQATSKDMDFAKMLEMTADRIRAGFRVGKTIFGTAESDTNRATAETADYVFSKRTIKPKMEMIVATFNEFIVPRFGDNFYLGFNDPVPEDKAARTVEMQAAVANKQVITQNEAREEFMGLGPVDDPAADEITQDTGEPIKPAEGDAPPKKKPKPEKSVSKNRSSNARVIKAVRVGRGKIGFKTQFSRNLKQRQEISKTLATKLVAAIMEIKKTKDVVAMSDDEYVTAFYPEMKNRIDEYEPKIAEAVRGVATRQEKVVLKNLPNAIKTATVDLPNKKTSLDPKKLFDMKEWISITISSIEPIAAEFFNKEFASAALNAGTPEAQISATIRDALSHRMELLGRSYNQTVIDTLTAKLNEGLSQGFSRAQLADSVKDIYAWSKQFQAERIAKTETVAISNLANKSAWQAGGRVQTVKWYTSQKDNVCPFCQEMSGTEIDINQNFLNVGDEFTGADGKNMTVTYADIVAPPLHVNCFVGDTQIISPDAQKLQKLHYAGNIVKVTFADGRKLSVTPNHPILTARGFVAARLLKSGDKAIQAVFNEGIVLGDPYNDAAPASIGDVFVALSKNPSVIPVRVPVTPEDFHGDGKGGQGDVDVVSTDGFLSDHLDAAATEPIRKAFFNQAYAKLSVLPGGSDLKTVLVAVASAADGIMSGSGIAELLSGSPAIHDQYVRLADGANYNARIEKALADGDAADSEPLSDLRLALPGEITTNDVTGIELEFFHGDVYDLTAKSTVYTANGIITSNCGCILRPASWRPLS